MAAGETRTEPYFPLLDALRLVAVVGVVWLHVTYLGELKGWTELGRFAVPFFASVGVYLAFDSLRRHPDMSLPGYALVRFRRVYVVFLAWSVIYLGVRWVNALMVSHIGTVKTSLVDFFWNGEAFQLWFLPFIFLATLGAFAVALLVRAVPWLRLPVAVIFLVLSVVIALLPMPSQHQLGYAALNSYESLPSCFAALGLVMISSRDASGVRAWMLMAGAGMVLVWLVGATVLGHQQNVALTTVAGVGCLAASLGWSTKERMPLISYLGSIAFGIYLVHLLFVESIQQVLPKLGFARDAADAEVFVFTLALAGSVALVALLRVSKWTRWLAG